MSLEIYLAYLAMVLVFFAHPPGPSQLLFMAHSLRYSVRRSLPTMVGDLSANTIQILIAGFGLVGVIALSANFLLIVKWLGAAYLVWIGIRTILSASKPKTVKAASASTLFRQGFLTSAANPYAVVFFAALFPQIVDPAGPLGLQIFILGTTYIIIDGAILLLLGFSTNRVFSLLGSKFERWIAWVSGGLMIAAAILLSTREIVPDAAGQDR